MQIVMSRVKGVTVAVGGGQAGVVVLVQGGRIREGEVRVVVVEEVLVRVSERFGVDKVAYFVQVAVVEVEGLRVGGGGKNWTTTSRDQVRHGCGRDDGRRCLDYWRLGLVDRGVRSASLCLPCAPLPLSRC